MENNPTPPQLADASDAHFRTPREPRLQYASFALATAIAFLLLPFAWQKTYAGWQMAGIPFPRDTVFLVAVIVLVALLMWRARPRLSHRVVAVVALVGLVAWCAINGAMWHRFVSWLSADAALLVFGVATSLWLFWIWLAFLLPASARLRWIVLALLVAIVPLNAWLVRSSGGDGDFRLMLAWRHARPTHAPVTDRATPADEDLPFETGDFTQFRGSSRRDGVIDSLALEADWTARPPRERWRIPVGLGWSGFAVAGDRAITHEQRGDQETVVCYDLATGRELWTHTNDAAFRSVIAGDGPRATPTVADDRVVTLGATGLLDCLDLATGKPHWSVNILQDNGAENLVHGACGSPLVVGDLVIVSPGGADGYSLAAYHLADGRRAWQAGSDAPGYASPQLTTLAGVEQVLILNAPGVAAHDPATGRVLWTHPWQNDQQVSVSQPLLVPNDPTRLFISSGYGKGCTLIEVTPGDEDTLAAQELWTSRELKTKFTSAVVHGDSAYGLDDGILACVDLTSGKRRWKKGRYGHGQILLAGELLLVQAESGEVVLVAADPAEHRELATLLALDGRTWNHPTLAGRLLLVRNDRQAVCYELPLAE